MASPIPATAVAMLRMWLSTGDSLAGQMTRFTERMAAVIGLQAIHALPTRQRLAVQAAKAGYLSALSDLEAANAILVKALKSLEDL